jgi:hypothetical protein
VTPLAIDNICRPQTADRIVLAIVRTRIQIEIIEVFLDLVLNAAPIYVMENCLLQSK